MTKTARPAARRPLASIALALCCALAPALALASPAAAPAARDGAALDARAARDGATALDAAKGPAPVPGDWTLGEREQWQKMQKELAQYVSLLNTSCQTTIDVSFDYETFRGKLMEPGKTGLAASPFWTEVTESLGSVRELCLRGGPGKAAVKAKVTKMTIQHAGGARAHKLDKGQLTAVVDPAVAHREWNTKFQEFLKQSL
ncbi:MAG TPA: hypothetical protein VFS43_39205 [Polyangiaceae bacterium]|nr:hypothetical protein [Polyangiaceae bacterium]